MKSKIPLLKKKDEAEYDEELEDESTDIGVQVDKTGETDISELEEEEPSEGNNSLVYKLKSKLNKLTKKKASAADDGEDDQAAKKKKNSRIIQLVIGLGLLAFLASDYILPPEENTEQPVPQLKPRPKPKKAEENPEGSTADAGEQPAEQPADKPAEDSVEVSGETTTEQPITLPDTSVEVPVVSSPESSTNDEPISLPASEDGATSDVDFSVEDGPVVTEPFTPSSNEDIADDGPKDSDDNLTDKILQDLEKQVKSTEKKPVKREYVAPPDYEFLGRGLVYNCTGKHWACVDGPSYKTCEDNHSSVKFLKKKVECYPFNVYETQRGCEGIQNRMVSSGAKTDFCKE